MKNYEVTIKIENTITKYQCLYCRNTTEAAKMARLAAFPNRAEILKIDTLKDDEINFGM